MNTIDLSIWKLILIYLILIIPIAIIILLKLGLLKSLLISLARMTIQLAFVGLYLKFIFDLNSMLVNITWLIIMAAVASFTVLSHAGLKWRRFFPTTFAAVTFATSLVVGLFVVGIIQPAPFYDAQYIIPIFGMVLGNCMRSNVLSLERFFSEIRKNENEFVTYQLLGANLSESTRPYLRSALRAAVTPHISTMTTLGIVSLPGMMTGQILGGSFPSVAIKYQIAIMICIFSAMLIGSTLNLILNLKFAFDNYGMLRHEIFKENSNGKF